MAAGNTRAADPVDTVHHEMDSVVCSDCFYKCVVASNRKTTHPREGASWTIHTMNLQYVAHVIKNHFICHEHLKDMCMCTRTSYNFT